MLKGIDVSKWQGSIDWSKVKDQVDFVILRAGYGKVSSQKDERFEEYYAACEKYGIKKGVYWFSYAETKEAAIQEANACYECIKGKKFEYPVWFDYEAAPSASKQATSSVAAEVIPAFIETLKAKGYYVGLYSYYSLLKNVIPKDLQTKYDVWLAHYANSTSYTGHKIWQYSEKGNVNGISGTVDMNYCYVEDYPSIITNALLNNTVVGETDKPQVNEDTKVYPITSSTTENKIVKYDYDDNTQLSKHFNVREFRCKCGKKHEILINTLLVAKLEKLHETFGCSMINLNSGYRCVTHDKNVGGTGTGQHTKGNAADIVVYDKNKSIISTKKVSCAAQDIGFKGIANINKTYTAIHVDVRDGVWKGNEIVSNGTVTTDFYKYYGLTKKDVYGEDTPAVTPPPAPSTPTTPSTPSTPATPSTGITAGTKVVLNNDTLYASSTASTGNKRSGTFYVYNEEVVNNRIRITNSASNVGKTPTGSHVTGWVDVSVVGTTSKKSLTAGTEITLNNTSMYASAGASRYASKKTGKYYIYSDEVVSGRIRITNAKNNVGKTPAGTYVSGWVDVSDIQ